MKATKNSFIKGIGNDIVEISRIKKMIGRFGKHVLDRLFTKKEQEYCNTFRNPMPHYAGRFAAKEAIVKALGTGISKDVSWLDIEINKDQNNKPVALLSDKVQRKFQNPEIFISISHSKEYATAVAIYS